ncbi:MAG: DUF6455 family protein [Dinoroseobacter sp.]|nr:DUF6455 family protein [Dinoroseobacter sp.]MDJ0994846.1 DUF6455 family protein [Dinoroseobacter sp.]
MTNAISTQASPCPKKLGNEVDHIWLVQRMAKTAQVDLVAAYEAGDLTQEDWAAMIESCRGCGWAEGCGEWLSVPDQSAEVPPESCLNRARMAALRMFADVAEDVSAA